MLAPGAGILCFIVPGAAGVARATTRARAYERIVAYRLPDPPYAGSHQVVGIAQRRARPRTSPAQITQEAGRRRALLANAERGARHEQPRLAAHASAR